MPTVTGNYSSIPTKTLQAIRDNQYRSADAQREYDPEEVDRVLQSRIEREAVDLYSEVSDRNRDRYELRRFIERIRENSYLFSPSTLTAIARDLEPVVRRLSCD